MDPTYNSTESILGASCSPISGYWIHLSSVEGINETYWAGLALTWLLEFVNAPSTEALYLLVQNGVASELVNVSGQCEPDLQQIPTGPLIDSTSAAWAAEGTMNWTEYVSDLPRANATYTLLEEGVDEPVWAIDFMGCDGETQVAFSSDVSATTGTVIYSVLWYPGDNATCGS